MRSEKKPLFKKEAQEEAKHFGMISVDQDALNHVVSVCVLGFVHVIPTMAWLFIMLTVTLNIINT